MTSQPRKPRPSPITDQAMIDVPAFILYWQREHGDTPSLEILAANCLISLPTLKLRVLPGLYASGVLSHPPARKGHVPREIIVKI